MEKNQLSLDNLQEKTEKVLALLRDRQTGLVSWNMFLHERLSELHALLDLAGYRSKKISEPARKWREENGVIYFSVISDGTTGEEWIKRLENKGFRISDYAKQVLRSPDFKPTSGVTTEIAVLKGMLFADNDRITKKIRAEAGKRKLMKPNAETAIIIREKFTDEELKAMGLWWIVVMHEPIKDSVGSPNLLDAHCYGDGRWLSACYGDPDNRWLRGLGFAFAVSPQ